MLLSAANGSLPLQASTRLEFGAEQRLFKDPAHYPFSLFVRAEQNRPLLPKVDWEFEVLARHDASDSKRNHWDLRRAMLSLQVHPNLQFSLGQGREFWGVTESHHLVNIINQQDAVEDLDGEDYLGQPMAKLRLRAASVALELFALPRFRNRPLHLAADRLNALPADPQEVRYESDKEQDHSDWAGRVSLQRGGLDAGLSYFDGTSREPRFAADDQGGIVANYDQIQQIGLDAQFTKGNWLWKLESIHRRGQGPSFRALVAGLEATQYGAFGTSADLGWVVEYLYDGRDPQQAPVAVFDDDLFVGLRWQSNDLADREVLLGVYHDLTRDEQLVRLEAFARIGARFTVSLNATAPISARPNSPLYGLRNNGFVSLTVALTTGWGS